MRKRAKEALLTPDKIKWREVRDEERMENGEHCSVCVCVCVEGGWRLPFSEDENVAVKL